MEGRGGLGKGKRGRERKGEVGDSALVVGGIDAPVLSFAVILLHAVKNTVR